MSVSALHEQARLYAEAGLRIFPCWPGTKVPATPNSFHDASKDPEQIERWWRANPQFNLAMCPDHNGWFVVDLDRNKPGLRDGAAGWAELIAQGREVPTTFTVRPPGGGTHLYFAGSARSSTASGKDKARCIMPGTAIDTRGQGGYVLLPPSVVEGRAYEIESEADVAPLPGWIADAVARSARPAPAGTALPDLGPNVARARSYLTDLVRRVGAATQGERNSRTFEVACTIRDLGCSLPTTLELVAEHWNAACTPPLDAAELAATVESAYRNAQNGPGAYAAGSPSETFAAVLAQPEPEKPPSKFRLRGQKEWENQEPVKWLVPGVLQERSSVIMYGRSQAMKSFVAIDLALSIATGTPCFGVQPQQGTVVYAALEGLPQLEMSRLPAWRLIRGTDKIDQFWTCRAPLIAVVDEVQAFGDEIAKMAQKPALIVVDTITKSAAGLDLSNARDAGRWAAFSDSLRDTFGCSVLGIGHAGKEETRGISGSEMLRANADAIMMVKREGRQLLNEVWIEKFKDAPEPDVPFCFDLQPVANSLVPTPISYQQYKQLVKGEDLTEPKKIATALRRIGAPCETYVLASEIVNSFPGESVEDREATIKRVSKTLNNSKKGGLAGYLNSAGQWALP